MIIPSDLRCAIRSAEKAQSKSYETRMKREAEAVAELFRRKPALSAQWKKAKALRERVTKLNAEAWAIEKSLGLSSHNDTVQIRDDNAFVKAGGRMKPGDRPWTFDAVMAELAAAAPKEAAAILKRCNIHWK